MKVAEYKKHAARTLSKSWHLTLAETVELHAAMGICTEFGELREAFLVGSPNHIDKVNVMEECGDVLWYVSIYQRIFTDLDWEDCPPTEIVGVDALVDFGTQCSLELLDGYKKKAYYGKEIEPDFIKAKVYNIYRVILELVQWSGYTIEETRVLNILKLKKRFPNDFVGVDAIDRDVLAERKVLEDQSK